MRVLGSWWVFAGTCAVAATAFAIAGIGTVSPSTATIGTHLAIDGVGFGTTKAPKVVLVPQTPGHKTLPLKIVLPFTANHLDVVVTTVKATEVGAYDVVVTPAESFASALTAPGAVTIGYAVINTFTPQVAPGGQFTISGSLFGTKKGFVKVGTKKTKIVSWTDTQIVAKVSKKSALGVLGIWVHNKVGNTLTTTIGITVAN